MAEIDLKASIMGGIRILKPEGKPVFYNERGEIVGHVGEDVFPPPMDSGQVMRQALDGQRHKAETEAGLKLDELGKLAQQAPSLRSLARYARLLHEARGDRGLPEGARGEGRRPEKEISGLVLKIGEGPESQSIRRVIAQQLSDCDATLRGE